MLQDYNYQSIKVLKRIVAYLFLYAIFIGIFYYFAYNAWICVKPIGLVMVSLLAFVFFLSYVLINHLIISKIVGLKIVVIFETILFLSLFVLSFCYAAIENRFHGDYSAQTTCNEAHFHMPPSIHHAP